MISSPIFTFPGAAAVASVNPDVEPTVKVPDSTGKNVTAVLFKAAVVAVLNVREVPFITVIVVPSAIPVPSTIIPTAKLAETFALVVIAVAPSATDAVTAPVPTLSASTKVMSPPKMFPDALFDKVTTLPDIELTVVSVSYTHLTLPTILLV